MATTTARSTFNAMHDAQPDVVVSCATTAEVVEAVKTARDRGLAVAVRGGGHSIAGLSTIDGGMLIDLGPMNGVEVDAERRLAKVQGGALWSDVDQATQQVGLATPGGVVSDTGVAGLTLGGGYGWLRRKHGLSSDNVREAEIVTADGSVADRLEGRAPRPLLGDPRRRRQLRHRDLVHVRPAPGRAGGGLRGDLLPDRGGRRGAARLARLRGVGTGRGDGDLRDDHVPRQPRPARGDPRPAGARSSAASTPATSRRACA